MKYVSKDCLGDFEFHDCEWTLRSYDGQNLVLDAHLLNIHANAPQNPHELDMEIELAQITMRGFSMLSFEPSRLWKQDADGNSYTDEPYILYEGKEAEAHFLKELNLSKRRVNIFDFLHSGKTHTIYACGDDPFFSASFIYDSIEITWDAYSKPAWYTEQR